MPNWQTIHAAASFWGADEQEVFPLPVVAAALNISRNDMGVIPGRLIIDKRGAYRKASVIDFALSEEGGRTLDELRAKRQRVSSKEVESAKLDYYKRRWIAELRRTVEYQNQYLQVAPWPLDEETEALLSEYRKACLNLRMEKARVPAAPADAWWMIDDETERNRAHRDAYLMILSEDIEMTEATLRERRFDPNFYGGEYSIDEWMRDTAARLDELRTEKVMVLRSC